MASANGLGGHNVRPGLGFLVRIGKTSIVAMAKSTQEWFVNPLFRSRGLW